MKSKVNFNIKINLSKKSINEYDLNEGTEFKAHFENGALIVSTLSKEEHEKGSPFTFADKNYVYGYNRGYESGKKAGIDVGLCEGQHEGYLVGYKIGFDDCRYGESFDNSFLSENDFYDCLNNEMGAYSDIDEESQEITKEKVR